MRLLVDQGPWDFGLMEPENDERIPCYAVLSHTWGSDNEELLFKDFIESTGQQQPPKPGRGKVEFCRQKASVDGLRYFWVDTCCIDRSSSSELSEAINSMFRWYKNASRCYVYLSDVSKVNLATDDQSTGWEMAFRKSRWFTRGWTLQELIAPASVEFFSREGQFLGNKRSLEKQIHEITGIPVRVLRGESLDNFGIEERLSWAKGRATRRQEDQAYSLLGIFDIHVPLLYGEGKNKALARLWKEIYARESQPMEMSLEPNIGSSSKPSAQLRPWKPRYYFFYGSNSNPITLKRYLRLAEPPIFYQAHLKGYSIARLGSWKMLLNGPTDGIAEGIAYKVESELHESALNLAQPKDYFPAHCVIIALTGNGWVEIEGRTHKYCGSANLLKGVLPGAGPFENIEPLEIV